MVDDTAEIGIFGGTGIYDSELLQDSKEITIETPYGKTSDTITIGEFEEKRIAFMPRHGKKHSIPPHLINYWMEGLFIFQLRILFARIFKRLFQKQQVIRV